MPAVVSSADVENCLREILGSEGFSLSPRRAHGQQGVDIIASDAKGEAYHIEVVGYKSEGPARAKDFYEGFFRTVSRLDNNAKHCILALSHRAAVGLPARARQHGTAWMRIAEAFPELEIWLVDTEGKTYKRTTWREWVED
jgi:hypothetical protein